MEAKNWEPIIAIILVVIAVLIAVFVVVQGFWQPAIEAGQSNMAPNWY